MQALLGAPMAAYSGCGEGDGGIGHGERRSRTGLARVGGAFGWPDGGSVADGCRQAGNGMACSRARAPISAPLNRPDPFALIAERYERRSLGITSNLVFSEWERIFSNPMATAAAIDRVVHHSVIMEFDVPSYRTDAAQQRSQKQEVNRQN